MYREYLVEIESYIIDGPKKHVVPKHNVSCIEFGDVNNENVVITAHGLSRNAHDFDKLSECLKEDYRIISMDYPGRGNSDYFSNAALYNYQTYVQDSLHIIEKFNIKNLTWIGTSMGGIIGIILASTCSEIFKKIILNDIGPFVPATMLAKAGDNTKITPRFQSLEGCKGYLKKIYGEFGIKDEEDWNYLTKHSFKQDRTGLYQMTYDPEIAYELQAHPEHQVQDINLWWMWEQIKCPILVIHSARSKVLDEPLIKQMQQTQIFDLYNVEYAGHAPSLMTSDQINAIKSWLSKTKNNDEINHG